MMTKDENWVNLNTTIVIQITELNPEITGDSLDCRKQEAMNK